MNCKLPGPITCFSDQFMSISAMTLNSSQIIQICYIVSKFEITTHIYIYIYICNKERNLSVSDAVSFI